MIDCDGTLNGVTDKEKYLFKLKAYSNTGGHLDSHHEELYYVHLLLSVLFTIAYIPFIRRFFREIRSHNKLIEGLNHVFIIINVCVLMKIFSFTLEFLDMFKIKQSGHGSDLLGFLGHGANYLSQYILCCILIFLAGGWTIISENILDFEMFLPISFIIGIFKVMIIAIAKATSNDPDVHHIYDNWVGLILGGLQIFMFLYFFFSGKNSIRNSGLKKHKEFYHDLIRFGSVYFLAFPITLILSYSISPYRRNLFVEAARMISEAVGLFFMASITTSKKGNYILAKQALQGFPFK